MKRLKVSVFAWDMGHNALGRAYVLADLLRTTYDVEIVGAHFVNHGSEAWRPLRDAPVPMRRFSGTSLPTHFTLMEKMAKSLDSDVLFVSKPRLPSIALGILAKEYRNRPLLVDADDRELSFFDLRSPSTLTHVARQRDDPDFVKPFGRTWTQYCESLVPHTDGVTVSNVALQALLGGTVIPHARDEQLFDPARYDRREARARLGLAPTDRVVMFAGTPRSHKGVGEIVAALRQIGDPRNKLIVFGTTEYQRLAAELGDSGPWLTALPYQAFDRLPESVVCADLVCILQDPSSEISNYQIPAKITDALALGVPCLARRVATIEPLVEAGAIEVLGRDESLADAIKRVLAEPRDLSLRGREVFLESYSYGAVRPVLERVVAAALERPTPLSAEFEGLLAFHRSGYAADSVPHGVAIAEGERLSPRRYRRAEELTSPIASDSLVTDSRAESVLRSVALAHGEVQRLKDEIRREVMAVSRALARRTEVEGIREMVSSLVRENAIVLVVSKGDPDLVRLGSCRGRHFPSDPGGDYAGYYPATSEDAIAHLEELFARGAEYFVIPKSAFWWRDQYPGFWQYLVERCSLLDEDIRSGAIFAKTSTGRTSAGVAL